MGGMIDKTTWRCLICGEKAYAVAAASTHESLGIEAGQRLFIHQCPENVENSRASK